MPCSRSRKIVLDNRINSSAKAPNVSTTWYIADKVKWRNYPF